jgi:ATP-dependent Clp protease ATP-binding subunit ClpC
MKCERCQKNPAVARIDQIVNGRREAHFLCQSCAEELMGMAMNQAGGSDDAGDPAGYPFGVNTNRNNAAAGSKSTATAERQGKQSKTPTLDQYGRDLTAEAMAGLVILSEAKNLTLF